jgi:hypothetical protein
MASQRWLPPRVARLRNVACAIVLAAGWLMVLLLSAGRGVPALSASDGLDGNAVRSAHTWGETGDVSATWTSTQPVSAVIGREPSVWAIEPHGVTVTFYLNSVSDNAWFTFTPQISRALPGYLPTPYFFRLDGSYQATDWPVSLGQAGIQIELAYDPARLGGADPRKLQFFHFGTTEWSPQGGEVDLLAKTITLKTKRTQAFAVGGELPRQYLYLTLVMRE